MTKNFSSHLKKLVSWFLTSMQRQLNLITSLSAKDIRSWLSCAKNTTSPRQVDLNYVPNSKIKLQMDHPSKLSEENGKSSERKQGRVWRHDTKSLIDFAWRTGLNQNPGGSFYERRGEKTSKVKGRWGENICSEHISEKTCQKSTALRKLKAQLKTANEI